MQEGRGVGVGGAAHTKRLTQAPCESPWKSLLQVLINVLEGDWPVRNTLIKGNERSVLERWVIIHH